MSVTPIDFGPAGSFRFSRNSGRSLTSEALGAVRYPSPFFDLAHTYLPSSFKAMLRWCRYYFLTNPIINAIVYKMAEYPVTDLILDSDSVALRTKWEFLFNDILEFKQFEIETGIDYHAYGNAFISIHFPFQKYLVCKSCGKQTKVERTKYVFRDFKFEGECSCGRYGPYRVVDMPVRSVRDIRLIRWNPEYITIEHNEATGENRYYFTLPPNLANGIRLGKKETIERVAQPFIDAVKSNKSLLFSKDNLYHMKRPSIAQKDKGWGLPMILPVLKDTFYLQVLKKANECVSPETLIETIDGLKTADDVKVGDIVRTHRGRWQPVEDKWYRDSREDEIGVKITPTGLRAFPSVYSPNHPVLTIGRNDVNRRKDTKEKQISTVILRNPHLYEEYVCPAGQISVGDYVLYPRELRTDVTEIDVSEVSGIKGTDSYVYPGCSLETAEAFERLESGKELGNTTPEKTAKRYTKEGRLPNRFPSKLKMDEDLGYILGWYAGDGSCGARHVEFSIGSDDPSYYTEELISAVHRVFEVDCTLEEKNVAVSPVVLSNTIARHIIKGLVPGTATDKKVPEHILHASDEVKAAFLKGLFEADGHVREKSATLSTSSRDLAYDSYRMCLHLGCIATVRSFTTKDSILPSGRTIKGGNEHFHVMLTGPSKDRMLDLWSKDRATTIEVTSGKSGFFWKEYFATRVCAIEEVEEDTYIDFKITEDTTFCCPGVATKNSIAVEHIVPLRILFPQSAGPSSDVYSSVNLGSWRNKMERELIRWRLDNNYIPIMPIPVNQQTLGGDGKALLLSQEYRVWLEHIVAGMGVPIELVFGGLSFSGSNVSLRMLENKFLDEKSDRLRMVKHFIIPKIAAFMGWRTVAPRYKKFKMADDLQRSAFHLQLNQAGKLSDRSLMEDTDWDLDAEQKRMDDERVKMLEAQRQQAIGQATIQGESQMVIQKYQLRAQKSMLEAQAAGQPPMDPQAADQMQQMGMMAAGQPGAASPAAMGQMMVQEQGMANRMGMVPPVSDMVPQEEQPPPMEAAQSPLDASGPQMSVLDIANRIVAWLDALPDNQKQAELANLRQGNPQLYSLVVQVLNSRSGAHTNSAALPLPENKPPRRGPEAAMV